MRVEVEAATSQRQALEDSSASLIDRIDELVRAQREAEDGREAAQQELAAAASRALELEALIEAAEERASGSEVQAADAEMRAAAAEERVAFLACAQEDAEASARASRGSRRNIRSPGHRPAG